VSEADRKKWDKRYKTGEYGSRTHPSTLLTEWAPTLGPGTALDVASGAGRNSIYLAQLGFQVDAMDISSAALDRLSDTANKKGVNVNCIQADFDTANLPMDSYDLIVMVRYTNAELISRLSPALTSSGYFLCEEHLATDRDVIGPSNPRFRVAANELLHLARDLRIVFYKEGIVEDPDGRPAALAQIVACKHSDTF
jgi:SAM-dependent methyltransferase